MAWVPITLFILFLCVILPIFIIIAVNQNKSHKKIDVNPNMPIFINWTRQAFTDGYMIGFIKKIVPNKNNTYLIEFYAWDVEQTDVSPRPDVQSVIVGKEFIKIFTGNLSSRRAIVMAIGRNSSEYPAEITKTLEGDYLSREGQLAHLVSVFGKSIQQGDEAIVEAMKDYARGNVSKASLTEIKNSFKELENLIKSAEKREEKPS